MSTASALVVHYDAPTERKSYVHRSGRTARAGHPGTVVTMTTTRQLPSVTRMQKAAGVSARQHDAHTEPKPMTAESLAMHGVAGSDIEAPRRSETGRGQGRRAVGTGSRRSSALPRRDSVPPAGPRATGSGRGSRPDRKPRTQVRAAPSRERSDIEVCDGGPTTPAGADRAASPPERGRAQAGRGQDSQCERKGQEAALVGGRAARRVEALTASNTR